MGKERCGFKDGLTHLVGRYLLKGKRLNGRPRDMFTDLDNAVRREPYLVDYSFVCDESCGNNCRFHQKVKGGPLYVSVPPGCTRFPGYAGRDIPLA